MFRRKKCRNCDSNVNKNWNFCPECGMNLNPEIKNLGALFPFKMMKGKSPIIKGMNVSIRSGPDGRPIVNVKKIPMPQKISKKPKVKRKTPKKTEEPNTIIKTINGVKTITISLPDVKNSSDIDINQFENSIEVRAYVGDKAYFKLIPIPRRADISRTFKDGKLKIEVRR